MFISYHFTEWLEFKFVNPHPHKIKYMKYKCEVANDINNINKNMKYKSKICIKSKVVCCVYTSTPHLDTHARKPFEINK